MPWVRFDDQYTIHRKVRGLSDPAFRLHAEAIFWCARNLTDGFVPAADLPDLATARRPLKFVPELVSRGNWHEAASVCDSKKCPAHPDHRSDGGSEGWLIHDYFEYQPTKTKVLAEREKNAERQAKWRARQQSLESDSDCHAVSNGVTNGRSNTTPSRPVPSRRDGGSVVGTGAGSQSVRARATPVDNHAGQHAAVRHLNDRYGLTDDEADQVITQVRARARTPIKHLVRYLQRMAEGDLADLAAAVMNTGPPAEPHLAAVPDWCGHCDEHTRLAGGPDRPHRCPNCHPLRTEAS